VGEEGTGVAGLAAVEAAAGKVGRVVAGTVVAAVREAEASSRRC